jgi:prepilin-type N-terminal cleavage/methylation domain-containing protein
MEVPIMRFRFRHGFTLIELLIVVAIIAILAAIAVPNFLEAQVRSKVSRTKNDMRSLATAMEAYYTDQNAYPVDAAIAPFQGWIELTTPVAYITSVPRDPFIVKAYGPDNNPCFEMGTGSWDPPTPTTKGVMWAMASYGPDRKDDTESLADYPRTAQACPYDPTNGTVSRGDVYRLGPQTDHPNFRSDENPCRPPLWLH